MNPLTQIKNTQKLTKKEIELGLFEKASWHARFAHSAYIFAGGLDYDLTEGDLLAVFAQYGELVDVHLVRDKTTGKSRGFAFLAYEDQRSTVLAVDNLSGATVAGRKLEGEDPNAVPDEPRPKRQHQADGSRSAEQPSSNTAVQHREADTDPAAAPSRKAAGGLGGGRLTDAWQAPNSLFALLASAESAPALAAAAGHKARDESKSHKHSKHKHKEKDKKEVHSQKHKHISHSGSVSQSRSHSRSPQQRQQPQQLHAVGYGPPRPPGGSSKEPGNTPAATAADRGLPRDAKEGHRPGSQEKQVNRPSRDRYSEPDRHRYTERYRDKYSDRDRNKYGDGRRGRRDSGERQERSSRG
eukprot:GHRR01009803.1.p1 GENE.GHRR01009803.1~~GHRR01009803.1.p1  ORF type:complete len:355 (+),score=133.77 GHRR01009803.1:1195-2259(+)